MSITAALVAFDNLIKRGRVDQLKTWDGCFNMRLRKTYYNVFGDHAPRTHRCPWFNGLPLERGQGWCTYLTCKTLAHARRQYLRLPVKGRQIDQRGGGVKPKVLMWGRMK